MFVAADGAVGAVDDLTKVLCVVSDGDGAEHLERAAQAGVHIVLHAHGDNHDVWLRLVEAWAQFEHPPHLTLTHQANVELEGMHNPGGFTDGDRALCFIHALGRSLEEIECVGFRTDVVGQWSGTTNPERKKRKLAWMKESMRRLGVEHHLIRYKGNDEYGAQANLQPRMWVVALLIINIIWANVASNKASQQLNDRGFEFQEDRDVSLQAVLEVIRNSP